MPANEAVANTLEHRNLTQEERDYRATRYLRAERFYMGGSIALLAFSSLSMGGMYSMMLPRLPIALPGVIEPFVFLLAAAFWLLAASALLMWVEEWRLKIIIGFKGEHDPRFEHNARWQERKRRDFVARNFLCSAVFLVISFMLFGKMDGWVAWSLLALTSAGLGWGIVLAAQLSSNEEFVAEYFL